MDAAIDHQNREAVGARPQLSAWLWKPWYAKLWWAAIPVWWAGMAISTQIDAFASFYRGGIAGYLNVLFFPMTALMVLGVGYIRERLDSFIERGDDAALSDEEERFFAEHSRRELARTMKRWRAQSNPMDPRSGSQWIGNPMNPNNSGYINPNGRKHR